MEILIFQNSRQAGYGYAAFGNVTEGMDIIDQIRMVATGSQQGHQNVPLEAITIISTTQE